MDMITSVPPVWMRWTVPTISFFAAIVLMLLAFGIWDRFSPGYPRQGLLPIETTRGDRLFMGLLFTGILFCLWLKFLGYSGAWAVIPIGILGTAVIIAFF